MINQWQVTPHIFWHGTKASIFIIDEANELNALKRKPDGHDALHNLFKWLVMNTKELNCFHVILSSGDIGGKLCWYKISVIGDLPKTEASTFWQQWLEGNWEKLTMHGI